MKPNPTPPPPVPPAPAMPAAVQAAEEITSPFDPSKGQAVADMVNAFLKWKLPESVCSDTCVTRQGPGRIGTNLLTMGETIQMLQEVVCPIIRRYLAIDPLRAELERDLNRVRNLAAEDSMAEQRKRVIAESALTAERAKVRELVEALEDIGTFAQCISLSGPAKTKDLAEAWLKLDRISAKAAHAIWRARHAAPPTGTGKQEGAK